MPKAKSKTTARAEHADRAARIHKCNNQVSLKEELDQISAADAVGHSKMKKQSKARAAFNAQTMATKAKLKKTPGPNDSAKDKDSCLDGSIKKFLFCKDTVPTFSTPEASKQKKVHHNGTTPDKKTPSLNPKATDFTPVTCPPPPPPHLNYGLSDYSDPECEFHFSPVTTTSPTNCFAAFANEEEETKQKQCDKNDQIITEAHFKLDKMKVAFSDSDEDVDNGVEIILPTTLIDDDNDDDDDDDGDNLDKKPPARFTVTEQMDLLEEQCKKYKEMVMEREDSDSEASDAGMTEAQKATCCIYLNGLEEPEPTQSKPVKKKPAMSHDSTPPRKGSMGNSTVTLVLVSTTSSVYKRLHPLFGLHNSAFHRGGCQNSYDTPHAIQ